MYAYGVRGKDLDWYKDYLFDRLQIVEIDNTQPNESKIHSRVPQGFVLGLLLLIVFFDDLIDHVNIHVIKCDVLRENGDTTFKGFYNRLPFVYCLSSFIFLSGTV